MKGVPLAVYGNFMDMRRSNWITTLLSYFLLKHVLYHPKSLTWITTFSLHGAAAPSRPGPPHYRGFTITLRHTTVGRTPLDEWSARHRDLYLTTHNTHKRQAYLHPAGFEPTIPASELPQTHALEKAATEIGPILLSWNNAWMLSVREW